MQIFDVLFDILHITIVLINALGWVYHRIWYIHLIVAGLTTLSWVGAGAFYGWGYCFLTDWHWQVKESLGETPLPNSYIDYWLIKLFDIHPDPQVVANWVLGVFMGSTSLTIVLVLLRAIRRRKNKQI